VNQSTVILIVLSLLLGAAAWLVFLWAARRGEFDDVEGPKHRMLHDDDDEPERRTHGGRGVDP
jgi:cbb3-type cytochrome oxidase maturation protein